MKKQERKERSFKIGQKVFWAVNDDFCQEICLCTVTKANEEGITVVDEETGISACFPSGFQENLFTTEEKASEWLNAQPKLGWY